eukprot:6578258-Prymnesium_polylepis.1
MRHCCATAVAPRTHALARPRRSPRGIVRSWVGKEAPRNEKTSAFLYTQGYLKKYKRPPVLPITRYGEGQESAAFKDLFGPPAKEGGCCVVS